MPNRYVYHAEAITVYDSLTGDPIKSDPDKGVFGVVTFIRSCRLALSVAAIKNHADMIDIIETKAKIEATKPTEWIELTEQQWKIVEPVFRRPETVNFGVAWCFSAETHIRSWLDAPSKKPAVLKETAKQLQAANGVDESSPAEAT